MKTKVKQAILTFFSVFLITIMFSNVFGYSSTNHKPTYGVTTSNVNFRLSATLSSATKVKVVSKGTAVKIVGTVGNFDIIQLATNEVGLISKDYVKATTTPPAGAKTYENFSKYSTTIAGTNVALRGGPSTSFKVYKRLNPTDTVEVIGRIENFRMVVTKDNYVGMVREDLLTTISAPSGTSNATTTTATSNVQIVLNLINNERKKAGKTALVLDSTLTRLAQIKSDDMVKNNYFSHNSPTYGSPFKMIQDEGISYKAAGENIAGNPSLDAAVTSWMNSETHKKNILSTAYNYVGIGVTTSKTYGYVVVAMFIGK